MKLSNVRLFFFLCAVLSSSFAYSYPEMVRHGYVSCTACHVSPSGGGVLTPYGRELSREVLSTWGGDKETKFLYGWAQKEEVSETLRLGGDVRAVQVVRENSQYKRADLIPMQADLEVGVDDGTYAAIVGLGLQPENRAGRQLNQFFSRKHYFIVRLTEEKSLRFGKFMKSFGLNLADHFVSVRRDLRWDYGTESYNLEYSELGQKSSTFLTLINDDPAEVGIERESGFSARQSWSVAEISQFGLSYFYGRNQSGTRDVFGPFWIWSFNPHFFWMTEFDWQLKNPQGSERTSGYAAFSRLGYEAHKGVIPIVQFERAHLETKNSDGWRESKGLGLQWYPRPHWEFVATLNEETRPRSESTDFFWLLAHFYL